MHNTVTKLIRGLLGKSAQPRAFSGSPQKDVSSRDISYLRNLEIFKL